MNERSHKRGRRRYLFVDAREVSIPATSLAARAAAAAAVIAASDELTEQEICVGRRAGNRSPTTRTID